MNGSNKGMSCQTGCWALALGVGFVAFVLMLTVGSYGFLGAAFLGGIAAIVLGFLFSMIFCTPLTKPGEAARPGVGTGVPASMQNRPDAPEAPSKVAAAPTGAAAAAPRHAPTAETAPPAPGAAVADADAEAGGSVKPSKDLPGQRDLEARKGSWRYENGDAKPGDGESPGTKPDMLDAPRDGGADDLKRIKGVGPKLEQVCHSLGVYHFDQIANWTEAEIAWVDDNLEGFKGRVTRDDWVNQAKILASGGETEFSSRASGT